MASRRLRMGTGTGMATLLWLHIQRYDKAKQTMDAALLVLLNQIWIHPWLDWVMIGFSTAGLTIIGGMTWWAFARGSRQFGWSLFIAQGATLVGTLLFY